MNSKIKNIIIFGVIAVALILIYVIFLKPAPAVPSLTSSGNVAPASSASNQNVVPGSDFLNILLSVNNIKLDDSIFSDSAFASLHDNGIMITSDNNPGRPNPFAPIGSDVVATPVSALSTQTQASTPAPSATTTGTSTTGSSTGATTGTNKNTNTTTGINTGTTNTVTH